MTQLSEPVRIRLASGTRMIYSVNDLTRLEQVELLRNYARMTAIFDPPELHHLNAEETARNIIRTICEVRNIPEEKVMVPNRERPIAYTRHLCMFIIRAKTNCSLKTIGALFKKDHTTVIHANQTMRDLIETDEKVREEVSFFLSTC